MDLKKHIRRQLQYIQNSCEKYDEGHIDEAIRIATVLRTLLKDTKTMTSLLTHAHATNINLLDTCPPLGENAIAYHGMGMIEFGTTDCKYSPNLGTFPFSNLKPSAEWLNQIVYIINPNTKLSRKNIIECAAEKDGGAHVDKTLTPEYEALAANGAMGIFISNQNGQVTENPITDGHLVCLRQMGYEILNSKDITDLAK